MNAKKIILTIAAVLAAAAALSATLYIIYGRGTPSVGEVEEMPTEQATELQTEETTEPSVSVEEIDAPNDLTGMAAALLPFNADTVGWITIPNTKVDYPVVQSDDNAYYLDTGFDHKFTRAGAVFMDYRNVFGYDVSEHSDNIVIYGHNMANNSMFGSLRRYRQDFDYYRTNQFIELSSNYDRFTYVIFGLVIAEGSAEAQWRYWDMEEFANEQEFNDYVNTVRQKNMVDIDVDVKYGDQLLTLSTCYSDADDTRFLVIARKVREGEKAEDLVEPLTEASESTETTDSTIGSDTTDETTTQTSDN
ncbi:MAG: class B sortase [Oscillospiraceae bacterium]|nr:class B sortase [Oscillospiraceae bacterium]MBR6618418.1 class B sortase [Oscillospiraceae bacterium]